MFEELGTNIRSLRELKGWTQTEVADKIQVTQSAISQIENGKRSNLTLKNLARLAEVLGVEMNHLLKNVSEGDGLIASTHVSASFKQVLQEVAKLDKDDQEKLSRLLEKAIDLIK